MSSIQEQIENALNSAFDVLYLKVVNDSALHKGHVGDDGSGETHFSIDIRSGDFSAMDRVSRYRAVHNALGDLIKEVHAISISISSGD